MRTALRATLPLFLLYLIFFVSAADTAHAADDGELNSSAYFDVGRFVVAGSVEDREPVGIVDAFASSTEKVYCFLDAQNIKEDTEVSFVWYHEDTRMAIVTLPLRKGKRWRTYSSKRLGGNAGSWRVELHDADGKVVRTATFTVE
jgi:hypothetical protein